MQLLKDRIVKDGVAIGTEILKVDSFLNHMIDVSLMNEVGKEFARRFEGFEINKIMTIEASGIGIAALASQYFNNVPVVFAKKAKPNTMLDDCYAAEVKSFTKGTVSVARISKPYLSADDKILIIDDFLAHGEAAMGLISLVEQAGGTVVGVGAVIEKGFQGGGDKLRSMGYHVESLAIVQSINDGHITFA